MSMQKASEASGDDEMTAPRLLHRGESQAIVLGTVLAAIAGKARNNERRAWSRARTRVCIKALDSSAAARKRVHERRGFPQSSVHVAVALRRGVQAVGGEIALPLARERVLRSRMEEIHVVRAVPLRGIGE